MKRKRFGKLPVFTKFLWDKRNPTMHIKIDEERAVILDKNSPYPLGTIVTMSEFCMVILCQE